MSSIRLGRGGAVALLTCLWATGTTVLAQEDQPADDRMERLEKRVKELEEQLKGSPPPKEEPAGEEATDPEPSDPHVDGPAERTVDDTLEELGLVELIGEGTWLRRFTLGGYGEFHANFTEGDGNGDIFDIHRIVLFLGYEFTDWASFAAELEIEHAFVSDDSGGELVLEQAYIEFSLWTPLNVRVGRILTPMGIINQKHEPPSFNGVERPSFAKFVIPTTWSSDGVGIHGVLLPWLHYEAYVVAGLDGSEFEATDGIRGGRIKERPSFNEPAFTGRIDIFPFVSIDPGLGQSLRIGVSTYYGGLDNGNKGNDPGAEGEIQIHSADFEYTIWRVDLRGAIAYTRIEDAREIGNGAPSEVLGMYVEGAVHVWPDAWRVGILGKADLVLFVRYEDYNTQYRVPRGLARDGQGDRHELTFGFTMYFLPNLVLKMDYQVRKDSDRNNEPRDLFNIGVGWQF